MKPGWFDAFFILRPTLFFPAWTAFLAGYHQGSGGAAGPAPYLVWLACASGAAFLINQLTDRREDSQNGKLLPLWGDLISARAVRCELSLLLAVTILGGIWVGWEISFWLALFFLIAGIFYNFPPLRLKSRPILGIVACAAGGHILFLIGARAAGVEFTAAVWHGIPYLFAGAAASLLTHVPDVDGDRESGVRTFASVYGLRATATWSAGLVLISLILSLLLADYVLLMAAMVSLPLFIRFYSRSTSEAAETAVKVAIFCLALTVGITWPAFLLMIALYYPFARWYHRARLGLEYPTFRFVKPASAELPDAAVDFKAVVINESTGSV